MEADLFRDLEVAANSVLDTAIAWTALYSKAAAK
jgi:hypothetical protein